MLEKSFGLLFFLKQPKNQKSDERYVYLRITVDGIPKEISTKRMWNLSRWDQNSGKAKGTKEDALKLNAYLDVFVEGVYNAKSKLMRAQKEVTAELLKDFLSGKGEQKRMLLEIFNKHNNQVAELVGKDYAYKTLQKHRTTYSHTKAFISWKYCKDDVELKDLNYEFAKDFATWLKISKKCNHNSTMKYLTTLKSVIIECVRKKLLPQNPFADFKMTYKESEIIPLYIDELTAIRNKEFSIDRLILVKDIFVFSCYTGLAYVDVGNLKRSQIINMDGKKWIHTRRQKTGTPQRIPLLPQAIEILEKYSNHSKCLLEDYALPILSNQKMNAYLKEIADICGIKKNLTFHLARHTFATIALSHGLPLETVSSIMGHKKITQTQHYAKIVDLKVGADMAILETKLAMI